jgi:hypothetical protein
MDYEYFKDIKNVATVLLRDKFWSKIRGDLYKKVMRGPGGKLQWDYVMGIRSRDKDGKRIRLTEKNEKRLQRIVDYLNSEEGRDELIQLGDTSPPPGDTDSLLEIIQGASTDRQIKKEELWLFLKYKNRILKYLAGSL